MNQPPRSDHNSPDNKPIVGWISNSITPYRVHLFDRILHELPEVKLITAYTHGSSAVAPWQQTYPERHHATFFHDGEPIPSRYRPGLLIRDWRKGKKMIRWLVDSNVKAVIFGGYSDPGLLRVMGWCSRRKIPFFIVADSNIHGDRATGWKAFIKTKLLTWMTRRAAGFLLCGSAGREYFRKYGAAESQLFVAPYVTDFDKFAKPDAMSIEQAQAAFQFDSQRQRIIYCGRLVSVKRVDLLIDAFIQLALKRPNWDLVVVGDGDLRESLKSRLPPPLQNRVQWIGFCGAPAKVAAIFHFCEILVLPSDDEPWGIVVSEAVAAGLAVIASDIVGAAIELVVDNRNGFRFSRGNLGELSDALALATDPRNTNRLKSGSREIFEQWCVAADPIIGIRRALESVGLCPRREADYDEIKGEFEVG